MAQAVKPQNIETQQRISKSNNFPKDLLQRFISGDHFNHMVHEETERVDIELSLGLSLNGRFGVDPEAKKLTRSSSIPDFISPTRESNGRDFLVPMGSTNDLVRTCSLPIATEECRRRKEMQTLRRMEAKRKRYEKQRNLKAMKDRDSRGGLEEESCEDDRRENGSVGNHLKKQFVKNLDGGFTAGVEGLLPSAEVTATLSQGSIGSQGSGSSGISESESLHPVQGMNKCTAVRSPVGIQSLSEGEQKLSKNLGGPVGVALENNRPNKLVIHENGAKEMVKKMLYDMPFVSTKGDGPNGKRIEGFLYRYGKGEEVRIVCVCHGSSLSPAEFVKHAGGVDVSQPLKHIVVKPSPFL